MRGFLRTTRLLAIFTCVGNLGHGADIDPQAIEFFETRIRPVLVNHCYECHSEQADEVEGNLHLDSSAGILAGGESGPALVPGTLNKSLLLEAIGYSGSLKMPPDGKLAKEEIAALTRWVELGAPWSTATALQESQPVGGAFASALDLSEAARAHWAFQPITRPSPPMIADRAWIHNEIDTFIAAKLEEQALHPVKRAAKQTLIRRATFDLTGLPPTAKEIDAFLADESSDAYEQLIDRLLASRHYGERWARYWLDIARYGEDQAHNFQPRLFPYGYRYRDWVIEALNSDMPYDRFTKLQIAGDLMDGPEDEAERRAAVGFLSLGPHYYNDRTLKPVLDEIDDRIDTLGRGFLGLTVACARCHAHKFDPIPTQDYYSLASIFFNTEYKEYPVASEEVVRAYDEAQAEIASKNREMNAFRSEQTANFAAGMTTQTAKYLVAAWKVLNKRKIDSELDLEEFADREGLYQFAIQKWVAYLGADADPDKPFLGRWHELVAQQDSEVDLSEDDAALEGVVELAESLQEYVVAVKRLRDAAIEVGAAAKANTASTDDAIEDQEDDEDGEPPGINRIPKSVDDVSKTVLTDFVSAEGVFGAGRKQIKQVLSADAKDTLEKLEKQVDKLEGLAPEKYPVVHSLADAEEVKDLRVRIRGNFKNEGDMAPRGFLRVLSDEQWEPFSSGSGRMELAEAIANPENPLTARVMVNRIWHHHFGRGLVNTPSNFGALGDAPSHPELLDYLAGRFIEMGWSVKKLHREIMLSATYQLSSELDSSNHAIDPENVSLWRANRRRLDIEALRDSVLAVAGTLDREIGGPSLALGSAENKRRTLYAKISRHKLNSILRTFDFPDPNITSDKRAVTLAPLQQLFTLNSGFMIHYARALAARLTEELEDDETRIVRAYRLVYGRQATDDEVDWGMSFLASAEPTDLTPHVRKEIEEEEREMMKAKKSKRERLNGAQQYQSSRFKVDFEELKKPLSPWDQYAQVLLATNEFMYVD